MALTVGITNTRLNATKRGIAVELALRLAVRADTFVGLVGADPTDRDVQRHLPDLAASAGDYRRVQVARGLHTLEIALMPRHQLCAVTASDRVALEAALPEIRTMFDYVIIDAPSRVGGGVGISHVLLDHLDLLLVSTGPTAGELALARHYVEDLLQMPSARHVAVRVVTCGHPHDSGLSSEQLDTRLRALPMIGWLPTLWGRANMAGDSESLDAAFRPIVRWIMERRRRRVLPAPRTASPVPSQRRHIANRLYRAQEHW